VGLADRGGGQATTLFRPIEFGTEFPAVPDLINDSTR
jgi:hypothetical protein